MQPVQDAGLTEGKACLPGTRTRTLERLTEWINNPNDSRILFLVGGAGLGKSSIAHTLGVRFEDEDRLGSFFCFNHSYQAVRGPDTLFRTIACQLSDWDSEFRDALVSILRKKRSSINIGDISSQWRHLILAPAKHLTRPVLLVIDALDESGPSDGRQVLLSFLTERAVELPSNFRIIVTSRPEPDIINAIRDNLSEEDCIDLNDEKEQAIHDIDTYIRHRFRNARPKIPDTYLNLLVKQADGLFQWAFTACEWMLGKRMAGLSWPERFNQERIGGTSQGLDGLYSSILTEAFDSKDDQVMSRFRSVMAQILSTSVPLSVNSLDKIRSTSNNLQEGEINLIVPHMGALLIGIADDDTPVQPYHTSFHDFLTTGSRSQEWYVNLADGHTLMALGCFGIMNKELHFNICDFSSSSLSNNEMLEARGQVDLIPQPLKYACLSWAIHIADTMDDKLVAEVKPFAKKNLLSWLEVLSVLQLVGTAGSALGSLAKAVTFYEGKNVSIQSQVYGYI